MANNENLKPFKKGEKRAVECGKKSKRGVSLKTALKKMFKEQNDMSGDLSEENFVKACTLAGMKGNAGMAKIIFEYIDGKVKQEIELEANVTSELTFQEVAELDDE